MRADSKHLVTRFPKVVADCLGGTTCVALGQALRNEQVLVPIRLPAPGVGVAFEVRPWKLVTDTLDRLVNRQGQPIVRCHGEAEMESTDRSCDS